MSTQTDNRPFRVDMSDEGITDLRRRIAATRWPSRELVADRARRPAREIGRGPAGALRCN
jgi:hypothetical protein